jgi:hypothetical protein
MRVQLERAGRDCEAAVRAAPNDPEALASRGLLRLTQGELDTAVADAEAALEAGGPKAWPLETRGLAELRKGQTGAGRTDLEAAAALDPSVAEQARRLGLAPSDDASSTTAR